MADMPHQNQAPRFRAALTPNRSLSARGFLLLMSLVAAINVVVGIAFLVLGAWPVFVFCGLDVALIWLAFRLNYRAGRLLETIEIGASDITLTRIQPSGARECVALNAYWARVQLAKHPSGSTELTLSSHGRRIVFARFLSDDERRELAAVLNAVLSAARQAGAPT